MRRPNIIFILLDDLGWKDLVCYGSSFYETPRLDELARDGMRFTAAYAACPVCSPTRASILTGKYPATVGITDWIDWRGKLHPCRGKLIDVPYLKELPTSEQTIAHTLRAAGYATWHVGKWHLGGSGHYPQQCGFEINVGGCAWGMPQRGYFSPWQIPGLPDAESGKYLTDHLTDEAIRLIRENEGRPFFLNFAHYAVHTPIQAPAELIEKYRAKAHRLGLDQLRTFTKNEFFPCEHKKTKRVTRRVLQSDPCTPR